KGFSENIASVKALPFFWSAVTVLLPALTRSMHSIFSLQNAWLLQPSLPDMTRNQKIVSLFGIV
ncbi:MAG: hypothetical protein AAB331_02065, partial [Planctomycetota bacterium]